MAKDKNQKSSSSDTKIIHVQVMGGTSADIYEIGQAMRKFKEQLPFKLEAIITNDKIMLQDVDVLVNHLQKLQKQIKADKKLENR